MNASPNLNATPDSKASPDMNTSPRRVQGVPGLGALEWRAVLRQIATSRALDDLE
jgi:hypothetical protein